MEIKPEDVQEVTTVGELHGDSVKMVKTWGGLHVMVGKKDKSSKKPDALAAASHRALACHQLEKMFGKAFEPSMAKSESEQIESVVEFSVSPELKKDHLEIYSIAKNNEVDFVVARFGVIMAKYECSVDSEGLSLNRYGKHPKASDSLKNHAEAISESIRDAMVQYSEQTGISLKK